MTPAEEFDLYLSHLDQQSRNWALDHANERELRKFIEDRAAGRNAEAHLRNAVGTRLQIAVRAAVCAGLVRLP